jgi:hypothetical protein
MVLLLVIVLIIVCVASSDGGKAFLFVIVVIIIIVCSVTYNFGLKKGETETYEPTKIVAIQTYEAEIVDLREQINDTSQTYERNIAALPQTQTTEIKALEIRQTAEIANLRKKKESELKSMQIKHKGELNEAQETYYIKGQVDTRSNVQNQIDSKVRENISKNDWDAPVFSTRR